MSLEALKVRDEILQVLFWRRGEGFGEEVSLVEIGVFLPTPAAELEAVVRAMLADGLLEPGKAEGRSKLSARGLTEGARRFADAFADQVGAGHGACGPGCEDCLTQGAEHCSIHDPDHEHDHDHDHGQKREDTGPRGHGEGTDT